MGPLSGIRIIEMAGLGPAPFCGMMLADMGAEVILIQRIGNNPGTAPGTDAASFGKYAIFNRGKKSITMDLKKPEAATLIKDLLAGVDGLVEGFRPGVMERLGLGPAECLAVNPKLVYGRITGWGQYGPLSQSAGHDINYIALSGALYHAGHRDEAPFAPPTLVGDIGGGAMFLVCGLLAGILQARETGQGQVVDAAITDGSALMSTLLHSLHQIGSWSDERADNILDSAAPWYDTYECADGGYITIGALEPKFYDLLLEKLGLKQAPEFTEQFDKENWPLLKEKLAVLFKSRARSEWCALLEGSDACFAPVLNFSEAARHQHNKARETFITIDGVTQAAPAPRFSRSPGAIESPAPTPGAHTRELLGQAGFSAARVDQLITNGIVS